jgi:hypothetical protein
VSLPSDPIVHAEIAETIRWLDDVGKQLDKFLVGVLVGDDITAVQGAIQVAQDDLSKIAARFSEALDGKRQITKRSAFRVRLLCRGWKKTLDRAFERTSCGDNWCESHVQCRSICRVTIVTGACTVRGTCPGGHW